MNATDSVQPRGLDHWGDILTLVLYFVSTLTIGIWVKWFYYCFRNHDFLLIILESQIHWVSTECPLSKVK